jgi:hypothetical protein
MKKRKILPAAEIFVTLTLPLVAPQAVTGTAVHA